jgi:Zn-dependent protease
VAQENGLRIGSFAGAAIVIEPTFLLLGAYVVGSAFLRGGAEALPTALIYVGVIFAAVLIHEIGHASVAAALNIPSKRIVLTFFGGYVQFARQPSAWPLLVPALGDDAGNDSFLTAISLLGFISLILGVFNLLPGFPLDGGHILRAALTHVFPRPMARMIAAVCGLAVAAAIVLFAIAGAMLWTGFIALLLGLAAWAELSAARHERTRQIVPDTTPGGPN